MTLGPFPPMDAIDRLIVARYVDTSHTDLARLAHCSRSLITQRVGRLRAAGLIPGRGAKRVETALATVPYEEVLRRLAALEAENDGLRRTVAALQRECRAAVDQAKHAIRKLDETQARIAAAAERARRRDDFGAALAREARA